MNPGDWIVKNFDNRFVSRVEHDVFDALWERSDIIITWTGLKKGGHVVGVEKNVPFDDDLDIPKFLTGDKPLDEPLQYARPLLEPSHWTKAKIIGGAILVMILISYAFSVLL